MDKIAIIVPVHNRKAITLKCIDQLKRLTQKGFEKEIVIIDDGSIDGTSQAIFDHHPEVKVIQGDGNLWWSGGTNMGVKYALKNNSDYVLTLNDDVDFENDFLERMLETSKQNPQNIVCGLICYKKDRDTILSAGRYRTGSLGYKTPSKFKNTSVSELKERFVESELESGYAMLIPQVVFNKIGFFDSKKFPHHMGDMDFVLRAREAGYEVLVDTKAILYTSQGKNYLFSFFVEKTLKENLMALFDVRSTTFWRTRCNFILRHTQPVLLASVSILYFIMRMSALLFIKAIFPQSVINKIAHKRYGKATYDYQ